MADSEKTAPDAPVQEDGVSPQRRRTARARAERELRLAANLRANIARRKQQASDRTTGGVSDEPGDDPAA